MITLEKELFILKLLLEENTLREVCVKADVSRSTAKKVKSLGKPRDRTGLRPGLGDMLSVGKEKMVLKLIADGKKNSYIADAVGCSRQSVGRIKKRGFLRERKELYDKLTFVSTPTKEHNREEGEHLIVRQIYNGKIGASFELETKRCPTCGGLITVWPCVLCNLQEGCY